MKTTSILSLLLAAALSASANPHLWTGLGMNARWSNAQNWDSGNVPVSGEPAPVLIRFPAGAPQPFNTNDIPGLAIDDLRIERAGYIVDLRDARLGGSLTMTSPFPGQSRLFGQPVLSGQVTTTIGVAMELVAFAQIGDTGSGGGFAKFGPGTLTLSGKNTFKGLVRIEEGFVEVTDNAGLGEQDEGVVTGTSGALVLRNVVVKGEELTLAFGGPNTNGTLIVYGTNEWIGPVDVVRDSIINAVTTQDEVTITGVLSGSAQLDLRGSGRVILAGDEANKHDGTVLVSAGELRLAKFSPMTFPLEALNGPLFIGTTSGVPTCVVRHLQDEQLFDKMNVTIRAGGRLEMDNHRDTISRLSFIDGGSANSGPNGRLTIGDDMDATAAVASQAHVSGNLSLGGATRQILAEKPMTLLIHANIEDGSASAGIVKRGSGVLVLEGTNTFTGLTDITDGILSAANAQALGSTAGGTLVEDGGSLALSGSVSISHELLTLNGSGFGGAGALYGEAQHTWDGSVVLASSSRIGCDLPVTLRINGVIAGPGALEKSGPGRLILDGAQNNTHGATVVSAGLMILNKTNALAIPGALTIGNGSTNATVRPALPEQIADPASITISLLGLLEMVPGSFETIAALSGQGVVSFDHGTLVVGANNAAATFHGQFVGAGNGGHTNVIKIGTGSFQLLNSTHTHDGLTIVRGGTFRMDSTQLASLISVENSGTLGGNGTCGPVQVNSGGRITGSGISSAGRLTVSSIPFSPGSIFHADLFGTTPATLHDQLRVSGGQNLNNAILKLNYNYAGAVGDTFVILDNQGASPINGTFAGLPEGTIFTTNGIGFQITYLGGTGNDVSVRLLAPPAAAQILQIDYISGQAKLLAQGTVGFTYYVEANDDLGNPGGWIQIGSALVGPNGTMAFTDLDAGSYPARFYRFMLP